MVSIHPHTDAKAAAAYYASHLATGSATFGYYSQDEAIAASWFGPGAERLGLTGPVTAETLERLCDNKRPDDGEPLTQRRKENAKAAYDITISAPKSVSLLALVMDDKRLLQAHERAVTETMLEIQRRAMVRVRVNGANFDRFSENIVGARFTHFTSRENDPQIHAHCLAANADFDEVEGCWKALQTVEIYRQCRLMTEVYRNRLTAEIHALGYPTESTDKGSFEIAGVGRELIELFSKRHRQIDAIATERGQADNPELRAGIARNFRKEKDTSKSIGELRQEWRAQLSPEQLEQLEKVRAAAVAPLDVEPVSASDALALGAAHLFERRSVVREQDLYKEALAAGRGQTDLASLVATLHGETEKYIVYGSDVTTHAALEAEKTMVDFVNVGVGTCEPLALGFAAAAKLTGELAMVVDVLLSSPDRVISLHGPAGAGKTFTLSALNRGLHARGHKVIVCAPYAGQVEDLNNEGFTGAMTLQRLLSDKTRQAEICGGVILLDEAGLVSVRQLNELFKLAEQRGCRVLLSGDTRQHKGTEAGDALRILEQYSNLARAGLSVIWRQKHKGYKQAIHALKDGDTITGFNALDKLGWVLEYDAVERYHRVGQAYLDAREHHKSCLVVCSTWHESALVTERIRLYLQAKRLLSTDERLVEVLHPLQSTKAHLSQAHRYHAGQVVVFTHKSRLFARDEHLEVLGSLDGFVRVKNFKGETLLFDPKVEAKRIALFEKKTIAIAPGESLLIRKNGMSVDDKKLINGERVVIKKIWPAGGITLADGRTLPHGFAHFCHGYAVTSQSSQGKTVDRVLVAIDAMAAQTAASRETLYVAASRGRERCTIFTGDKAALLGAFQRSSERTAALEFIEQAKNMAAQSAQPEPTPQKPNTPPTHEDQQIVQPTPGTTRTPAKPLPATGMAPYLPGLNPPDCQQNPRRRADSIQRAKHLHSQPGNPSPGHQLEFDIFPLSGTRGGLPNPPILHCPDQELSPDLGR